VSSGRVADEIAESLRLLTQRPVVIASHPRSGTHLMIDLFRRQFAECRSWKFPGEKLNRLYLSVEALFESGARAPISEAKAISILRRVPRPLAKTHLVLPETEGGPVTRAGQLGRHWIEWLRQRERIVYVYRDGRDVMCSYHFFAKIDPTARCPIGQFIRQTDGGVSRVRAWADHLRRWLREPGVVAVRFEDVRAEPRAALERLADELGLTPLYREPLLPRPLGGVWESRLMRLGGVRPQSTAIVSNLKGHRLERWREVFTRQDCEFFDEEAGELLLDLGYETSREWVTAQPASSSGTAG
jgi:hypothetical protein